LLTHFNFSLLLCPPPPRSILFPYTTLFRSTRGSLSVHGESHESEVARRESRLGRRKSLVRQRFVTAGLRRATAGRAVTKLRGQSDRKSTRLNSSHVAISYAVFCLKKKKKHQ